MLGQFETGGADLIVILGEACADPKISSPFRNNLRVSRKDK